MPYYNLQRFKTDPETLEHVTNSRDEALEFFGKKLGIKLTLKDNGVIPSYWLGERQTSMSWIKCDVPVYTKQSQ